ncbi:hypothetical protein ACWD00_32875 [Streptomyces viridiviolaceus]
MVPGFMSESRERNKDREEQNIEKGAPVTVSAGQSYYGPTWFATNTDAGERHEGEPFNMASTDATQPTWSWLWKQWTPVNSTGVSVNVLSKHKHTVLVQGLEISDLKCSNPPSRSAFRVPPIGDGGSFEMPAQWAFNIEKARPAPRELTADNLAGDLKPMDLALEQGDQREVEIRFFSATKSCTFKAALIISSNGKKYRENLPATWENGKVDGYTFSVTAPPVDKTYDTTFVATLDVNPTLARVPTEHITWDEFNRPDYIGPL